MNESQILYSNVLFKTFLIIFHHLKINFTVNFECHDFLIVRRFIISEKWKMMKHLFINLSWVSIWEMEMEDKIGPWKQFGQLEKSFLTWGVWLCKEESCGFWNLTQLERECSLKIFIKYVKKVKKVFYSQF